MISVGKVIIFRIPELSTDFCFGGGIPHNFKMLDWFDDAPNSEIDSDWWNFPQVGSDEWKQAIADSLKIKRYFNRDHDYLVLHRDHTFIVHSNIAMRIVEQIEAGEKVEVFRK